jgi:hypothetical protein
MNSTPVVGPTLPVRFTDEQITTWLSRQLPEQVSIKKVTNFVVTLVSFGKTTYLGFGDVHNF